MSGSVADNFDPTGKELYELSADEANAVLKRFLLVFSETVGELPHDEGGLDYSPRSVIFAFREITKRLSGQDYQRISKSIWVSRIGYYFGQSLVNSHQHLSWGTGDPKYAFANHPSVIGFRSGEEAETVSISRNLISSVVKGGPFARIENGVTFWFNEAAV